MLSHRFDLDAITFIQWFFSAVAKLVLLQHDMLMISNLLEQSNIRLMIMTNLRAEDLLPSTHWYMPSSIAN